MLQYLYPIGGFFVYLSIFRYFNSNNTNNNKYISEKNSRINSTINSFFIIIASYLRYNSDISFNTYYNSVLFTAGYFINDIKYLIKHRKNYTISSLTSYLIHHLLALTSINLIHINEPLLISFYFTEISTPLLNLSWFLIKNKKNNLFKINNFIVKVSFVFCRIFNTTYWCYYIFINNYPNNIPNYFKVILIIFTLLNYIWFYKLCEK
jgi:hypothetical protein